MSAIADHLWQSTWFVLAAWLLALFVRRDVAQVRYWVWLAASLKFLLPFALFGWIGHHFILQLHDTPTLLPIVQQVTAPLSAATISIEHFGDAAKNAAIFVWVLGTALLLARWAAEWWRSRVLVRTSARCDIVAPVEVRCSDRLPEPAVVGILNPVILLPSYALRDLNAAQIDAVIAHEVWHVRRRDNLTGALQALTQALFWFHPLVWWVGAQLVREREYACDDGALQDGVDPATYAETLLRVCRHSVASQRICAASAAGGDLVARVRAVVSPDTRSRASGLRRGILVAALTACAASSVASGMTFIATSDLQVAAGARSIHVSRMDEPSYVVVHDDYIYASNVSIRELISQVYSVHLRGVTSQREVLDYPRYNVELRSSGAGAVDPQQLVAELLKGQFNLELIVWPAVEARIAP